MNERIKELAERSCGIRKFGGHWSAEELEEFAELIVEECMNICTTSYRTDDGWGVTGGDVRCHYAIARHFDVKTTTSYRE